MDILKLLSRSTKQPNKALAAKDKRSTQLPSAGVSANPQLYHDVVPGSRGTKRKRGGEKAANVLGNDDEDIDFFAPKSAAPKQKQVVDVEEAPKDLPPAQTTSSTLDEAECRQTLRSHRVKVTILPAQKTAEKEAKKSKKAKVTQAPVKEEYKQIFPQPLEAFSDLRKTYGIYGRLGENLAEQGYKIPTEVQMGSLPLLLNPEIALVNNTKDPGTEEIDMLAVAPTGSGKTLAFLIPIANQILQRRRTREDKAEHILEAVVVAPTKELASQIVNEAKKLCLGTGIKVTGMRKGMRVASSSGDEEEEVASDEDSQMEEAEDSKEKSKSTKQPITKVDILVTTPGLLLSSLTRNTEPGNTPLPTVRTLVLDEADVLLDPLFRDQTLGIWSSCTNPSLRVTLWSATMGSNIEELALTTIHSRRTLLSLTDTTPTVRLVVGLKDSAIPNITHTLTYTATEPGKLLALRQLLHPSSSSSTTHLRPPFLIFTQTIPRAIALHSELLYDIPASAGGSSRIAVLHSSLSDPVRSQIMSRFRSGEIWILITTDILSRGVDFKGINGVVNYDVPNSAASYIHRVGRTGRAGRDGGVAVTFYTKEDIPFVKGIANVIAVSERQGGKVEGEGLKKWLLDALPDVGKERKKRLKMHGVEARREGLGRDKDVKGKGKDGGKGHGRAKMQISTKSGYERKLENNKKGAILGSKRRALQAENDEQPRTQSGGDGEWGGFDD